MRFFGSSVMSLVPANGKVFMDSQRYFPAKLLERILDCFLGQLGFLNIGAFAISRFGN